MARRTLGPIGRRRLFRAALVVLGVMGWGTFFWIPQWKVRAEWLPKVHGLRKELKTFQQKQAEKPTLEKELDRLRAEDTGPAVTIPVEEQLPDLLETIATAARFSEVHLLTVKPKMDYTELKTGRSGYLELPIEVSALAGYHRIGAFLDVLERSPSLLKVSEMEIQPNPKDIWHHRATVVFLAYLVPEASKKN